MPRKYNHPPASSPSVRRRMQAQGRRETACELAVRSSVHSRGLRYRLHRRPLADFRRRADLVFGRGRVAVFVDGCFWHNCPLHGTIPKVNSEWWEEKLAPTRLRDQETDHRLCEADWLVIRVWEHECPENADMKVLDCSPGRVQVLRGQNLLHHGLLMNNAPMLPVASALTPSWPSGFVGCGVRRICLGSGVGFR